MRLDPASAAAARWLAWRAAAGLLVAAALFAVATLMPVWVYKPSCGRAPKWGLGGRPRIDGPLRPEYVDLFTRAMREEGFRHWRVKDTILMPFFPVFDGINRWNWANFTLNVEWRIAHSIVNGYTAHGCASPPEAVRRLYGDIKGNCGVSFQLAPDGRRQRPSDGRLVPTPTFWIRGDCDLFRAAVVRIEDMPQPLPPMERSARTLRDKRAEPPQRDPAPQRP